MKYPQFDMRLSSPTVLLLLLVLGISANVEMMAAEHKTSGFHLRRSKVNAMKTDTITIPALLLDHLLSKADLNEWLAYLPTLHVEDEEKVYPAYAVAEHAAKEKQRAASARGTGKIKSRWIKPSRFAVWMETPSIPALLYLLKTYLALFRMMTERC